MTYGELQKLARELGLAYIGVPKAELEVNIKNAQSPKNVATAATAQTPSVSKPVEVEEKKAVEGNTAIVFDGNREVRRYSIDVHGPKFVEYANEFIVGRKYRVEIRFVEMMHTCPACGHKWND